MPAHAILPSSFFHIVKTQLTSNDPEAVQHAFCDGLKDCRNNDALVWLLVAAELTQQTEIVDYILTQFDKMIEDTDECQRIVKLYREKVEVVRELWGLDSPAIKFYGDWPDHMNLDTVFIRPEFSELTDRIKTLSLGGPGALVVHGTSGLGKTTSMVFLLKQIMLSVLPTKECGYLKRIFWLNVCNLTMVDTFNESDFQKIVRDLLIDCKIIKRNGGKTANAMKIEIDEAGEKMLFVIDDVFNIGVIRFMAKLGDNIRMLALTRNKMKAQYKNVGFYSNAYELPVMSTETIYSMLVDFYHLPDKPVLNEQRKLKRLANICIGLPLVAAIINQTFANLQSPIDIENTYWQLVKNFERLALSGVAVDKLGSSQNAVITVHSLLTYDPDFDQLAKDVLSAFLLFGPGDTVTIVDLQILWGFEDIGQVRQYCQPAVDAALLQMTADDVYILHDLLRISTMMHLKSVLNKEHLIDLKYWIIRKVMGKETKQLENAVKANRPNLVRIYHDYSEPIAMVHQCMECDLNVLKILLQKLSGDHWLIFKGSSTESSVSSEMLCRFLEMCLSNGSTDVVETLAQQIATTLHGERKWHQNLLFVAIKFRCTKVIDHIMQINILEAIARQSRDLDGNTLLLFAVMNKCDLALLKVLAPRFDGNLQNNQGQTVLHFCGTDSRLACQKARILFEFSPCQLSVDIQDFDGDTPLHMAIRNNNLELVAFLIEKHHANVTLRNSIDNANSLELAIGAMELSDIGFWLLQRAEVVMSDFWFNIAINKANPVLRGLLELKKHQLLRVALNARFLTGKTNKAHEAAGRKDHYALKKMQRESSHFENIICELNEEGATVLNCASHHDSLEIIKFLLENGAGNMIDHRENNGLTALMTASQGGNTAIVLLLLDSGATVDLSMQDGVTALFKASQNGHFDVVELLLNRGANVAHQRNDGATALHIACYNGHSLVVELLLKRGANFDLQKREGWSAIHIASQTGRFKVIELLLESGANVDLQRNDGWTALQIASHSGHSQIVDLLLDRGANPDIRAQDGLVALHRACAKGYLKICRLLLNRGASIDLQCHNGRTALHIAVFFRQPKIFELLISQGANGNIKDNTGLLASELGL